MSLPQSPLPTLQVYGCRVLSPREHRRVSSEFGWFDIEPLLSSTRTSRFQPWGDDDMPSESVNPGEESALPPALERVFEWLNEVEGRTEKKAKVDEAIIDEGALLALEAPSSSVRRDGDKVIVSRAVTKADFSLASRDQPSFAIGIYAHRMVRRRRWLLWTECYAEYLVVVGTETELLSAWRCYHDFCSLASSVRRLGKGVGRAASNCWVTVERKIRDHRQIDPTCLSVEALHLGRFLATLVEEVDGSHLEMLSDFARKPTTYVVVGVDNAEGGADVRGRDDAVEGQSTGGTCRDDASTKTRRVYQDTRAGQPSYWCLSSPERTLGTDSSPWAKWQRRELVPLKPEPRSWEGL